MVELGGKMNKQLISDYIHESVCEFTGTNGMGRCHWYACGVSILLTKITGKMYIPQGGTIKWFPDPDDCNKGVCMDAELGGIETGEWHSWCVGPIPKQRGIVTNHEADYIDLTARHYQQYVENINTIGDKTELPKWGLGKIPDYIWSRGEDIPEWLQLIPDEKTVDAMFEILKELEMREFGNYLIRYVPAELLIETPKKSPKQRAEERRKKNRSKS